jgi:hypothetical protein
MPAATAVLLRGVLPNAELEPPQQPDLEEGVQLPEVLIYLAIIPLALFVHLGLAPVRRDFAGGDGITGHAEVELRALHHVRVGSIEDARLYVHARQRRRRDDAYRSADSTNRPRD